MAWEYDAASGQYYYHAFLREQPDLNGRNPAVRAAMHDVMRFWLKRDRSWRSALMFGAGHGGGESFIVGALTGLSTITALILRAVAASTLGIPADKLAAI